MNNMKNNDLNFIERYFDEELSKSELAEFEIRKKTDPEFAEILAFRQDLKAAFAFGGELEKAAAALEAKLNRKAAAFADEARDELKEPVKVDKSQPKNSAKVIRMYKRAMVAASVLFLFCTGCMVNKIRSAEKNLIVLEDKVMWMEDKMNNQRGEILALEGQKVIYEERMGDIHNKMRLLETIEKEKLEKQAQGTMSLTERLEHVTVMAKKLAFVALGSVSESLLNTSRGFKFSTFISRGHENVDSLLLAGQQKYKEQNYLGAIADFDKLLETHPDDNEVLFYKGLCHAMKHPGGLQEAISIFEELLDERAYHKKEDDLSWHLALLYVKTGDFKEAKKTLKKIVKMAEPAHKKKVEAEMLLSYII